MPRAPSFAAASLVLALGSACAGCSEDSGNTSHAGVGGGAGVPVNAGGIGGVTGLGGSASSAGAPAATVPELSVCERACDRVVDCAVDGCGGVDWRTAGLADAHCREACTDALGTSVLAAVDCAAVLASATPTLPTLDSLCNAPICEAACQRFADCAIDECSGLDASSRAPLAEGCADWCDDDAAGDLLSVSCTLLIDALNEQPAFAAQCTEGTGCASDAQCDDYATKVSGCLATLCGANVTGYEAGLEQLFGSACRDPDDCASVGEASYITASTTTCDSPGLVELQTLAPFATLCSGGSIPAASARAACEAMQPCSFFADFGSVDLCMALIALGDDPSTLSGCVSSAADCGPMGACFASQP